MLHDWSNREREDEIAIELAKRAREIYLDLEADEPSVQQKIVEFLESLSGFMEGRAMAAGVDEPYFSFAIINQIAIAFEDLTIGHSPKLFTASKSGRPKKDHVSRRESLNGAIVADLFVQLGRSKKINVENSLRDAAIQINSLTGTKYTWKKLKYLRDRVHELPDIEYGAFRVRTIINMFDIMVL